MCPLGQRGNGPFQITFSAKFKCHCDGMECVSAHSMDSMYIFEGTVNVERCIRALDHLLLLKQHLCKKRLCSFQANNAKPHSAPVTPVWHHSKRVTAVDWSASSPGLSAIKNVCCIMETQTAEQLKLYMT